MSLNETVTMVTKGSECDVGIHKPKPWAIAMWKLLKRKRKNIYAHLHSSSLLMKWMNCVKAVEICQTFW